MAFTTISWLWLSTFIGLPGLPFGVPPQPEDPVMSNVAPEECLFYMSSAGMAAADAHSANQTEQLLAEPEVQKMAAEIERAIKSGLAKKMSGPGAVPGVSADDAAMLGRLFITGAKAVYLANLKIQPGGPPQVSAGVVVNLGESADKVKSLLDKVLASTPVRKTESDGATWYEIQPDPTAPIFKFGVIEQYFVLGIGQGEVEAMLKRAHGNPPAWLEKVRKDLPIERRSTVEYLNIGKIRETFLPLGGPQAAMAVETLGLNNVTAVCTTTGLDQSGFVSRTLVAIDGQPQGLFSFANAKPLAETDLAAIPADATFAAAVRIDPSAVFQQFLAMAEKFDPRAKAEILASLEQMHNVLGVKVPQDLLGPLGDTVSIYDSPSEGGLLAGLTAVVSVKDPAKAKAAFGKLVPAMQQGLNRPSVANPQFGMPPVRPALEKLDFAGQRDLFLQRPESGFLRRPGMVPDGRRAYHRVVPAEHQGAAVARCELSVAGAIARVEAGVRRGWRCVGRRLLRHVAAVRSSLSDAAGNDASHDRPNAAGGHRCEHGDDPFGPGDPPASDAGDFGRPPDEAGRRIHFAHAAAGRRPFGRHSVVGCLVLFPHWNGGPARHEAIRNRRNR